jgi:hypothetical protein
MNEAQPLPLSPPGRGLGEGWSPRVRRYMWADEDSGTDAGAPAEAEPPLAQSSPHMWGEGEGRSR